MKRVSENRLDDVFGQSGRADQSDRRRGGIGAYLWHSRESDLLFGTVLGRVLVVFDQLDDRRLHHLGRIWPWK